MQIIGVNGLGLHSGGSSLKKRQGEGQGFILFHFLVMCGNFIFGKTSSSQRRQTHHSKRTALLTAATLTETRLNSHTSFVFTHSRKVAADTFKGRVQFQWSSLFISQLHKLIPQTKNHILSQRCFALCESISCKWCYTVHDSCNLSRSGHRRGLAQKN